MTLCSLVVTATEVWTTVTEITMKEITRCLSPWVEVSSDGGEGSECTLHWTLR